MRPIRLLRFFARCGVNRVGGERRRQYMVRFRLSQGDVAELPYHANERVQAGDLINVCGWRVWIETESLADLAVIPASCGRLRRGHLRVGPQLCADVPESHLRGGPPS